MCRVTAFLLVLLAASSVSRAGWPEAFPKALIEEIEATQQQFRAWGLRREIRRYGIIDRRPDGELWEIDWENRPAVATIDERFLRQGERFRCDRYLPKKERRSITFDGQVARMRDNFFAQNGPIDQMSLSFATQYAPGVPHAILVDYFTAPPISWIFDESDATRLQKSGSVHPDVRVQESEHEGHPCWRIRWTATRDDEGGLISSCEVFLARDRQLFPIQQSFITPINRLIRDECRITIDEFERSADDRLWLPKRVKVGRGYADDQRAILVNFHWSPDYVDESIYSQIETLAANLEKPVKVKPGVYQPAPLLSNGIGSVPARPLSAIKVYRRPFSVTSVLVAGILFLALMPLVARTRIGIRTRGWIRAHPLRTGMVGIATTLLFGYAATYPPGWAQYGLSLMLTGVFGFAWILATFTLSGERTVSIRLSMCAALCAAVTFAGYSMGGKRMAVRERMIRDIRDSGGQVAMGRWRLDEPGLYLPRPLDRFLGEAWTGRASQAAVEQEIFTADNVQNWCLDEVRWLGIASAIKQPFQVSGHPFSKLRNKDSLWTVCVDGGGLDATAFDELSRFPSLVDLHFDCNYQPVDDQIQSIPLERLWLTKPLVDDQLLRLLGEMKSLEGVTLISPKFADHDSQLQAVRIKSVEVQFASLDEMDLKVLGKLDSRLLFTNCRFVPQSSGPISMAHPSLLEFIDSDLNDKLLKRFTDMPALQHITLRRTDVSLSGIEAYSSVTNDISVFLE
ncbi:MAG: hypothetical protein AAFV88_23790 [Planctomycetota bacterium]